MSDKRNIRRYKKGTKTGEADIIPQRKRASLSPKKLAIQFQKERDAHYRDYDEIQKLKDEFYKETLTSDDNKLDYLIDITESNLMLDADSYPAKTVFIEERRYQVFDTKTLISTNLNYELSLNEIRECLELKYEMFPNINSNVCRVLFRLMTIDNDYAVCETCFVILQENYHIWMPKLHDIVEVFLNWGATSDTLKLTNCEKLIIFNCEELKLTDDLTFKKNFKYFNYNFFLEYMVSILSRKCYKLIEIFPLVKMFITVALEKSSWIPQIQTIIHTAIDSLDNWENFKVITFARYIYDDLKDIHSLVAIAVSILPNTPKCQHISLCLSFAILRFFIKDEICFNFPNQDVELLQLVESMTLKMGTKNDLHLFYLLTHLINYIVCTGRFEYNNTDTLDLLQIVLNDLKDCISHNHCSIDAAVVKGRISYCFETWNVLMFEKNKEDEQSEDGHGKDEQSEDGHGKDVQREDGHGKDEQNGDEHVLFKNLNIGI